MILIKTRQVIGKHSSVDFAGHGPVILELMAALKAAYDQIIDAVPFKDTEPVNEWRIDKGADIPAIICSRSRDNDFGFRRIIG